MDAVYPMPGVFFDTTGISDLLLLKVWIVFSSEQTEVISLRPFVAP